MMIFVHTSRVLYRVARRLYVEAPDRARPAPEIAACGRAGARRGHLAPAGQAGATGPSRTAQRPAREGVADADAAADLATFQAECEASRAAIAGRSLDDVVPSRRHHPERARDIRWIFLHMIEEYARHNGHADLLREAIDGVTGD
jgi:hypothetical protein